ncbi:MAG: hypothetical protein HQ515_10395 [Phycisphaeraceae bacterium]|nr:hypothetical protein [Phycisphaeraceae bacterium]
MNMGTAGRSTQILCVLLFCLLMGVGNAHGQSGRNHAAPQVAAPPESFFDMIADRLSRGRGNRASQADLQDSLKIYRDFYKKYIDVKGMPVVAAAVVADEALQRTYDMVTHMLAGRPDILQGLLDRGMYLIIIGKDQGYCDMPENRNVKNKAYMNERVRGTGGHPTSFGEENLLSLPIDRYDDESIGVHEFCHTIDSTLRRVEPQWNDRRMAAYDNAKAKGLYKDTYAIGNPAEYWCEAAQAYFNCNRVNNWNHTAIGHREQLKVYDLMGYELCRSTFNLSEDQDWRYSWLQSLPNVDAPPVKFQIDPYYTKFTWAREFTVLGRDASDEALLKANDTIRKLFAYRHDILKALMAEGLRLVVLGPNESLADLPEWPAMKAAGVDHTGRYLEYTPGVKILAAAQENVLGDLARDMYGTESQVIRVFAKAIYGVTARRSIDPDWDSRRDVQQYELRVQRMDIRFDQTLKAMYDTAMDQGRWKGTVAVHNRVEYWTEGVMAYFDAVGQGIAPNDAARPVTTREALKAYDPGLYDLVNETMAYDGRVDWRYVR